MVELEGQSCHPKTASEAVSKKITGGLLCPERSHVHRRGIIGLLHITSKLWIARLDYGLRLLQSQVDAGLLRSEQAKTAFRSYVFCCVNNAIPSIVPRVRRTLIVRVVLCNPDT